ncbi:MAG: ABC transporter permease [Candidatus Latescibacteria bacterium]|nr:ABC transporter permease [Candidatus Latescibacterota bacterium]
MSERRAYLFMFVSVPILWILAIKITGFPPFLLPPPNLVAKVLWEESGEFLFHTGITLMEAIIGYLLANIIALAISFFFLYFPWLEALGLPWTVVIKNIPFVTIASILIITLGDSPAPKIIIVILVCFFPILANLAKGLKSVEQVLLDRMKVLNASKWQIFVKVRWPSALPYYIAAHEIAFTGSIIGAIVAEWMFARRGLGFLIVRAMMQYRADKVYAVTLIASLLAVGAYFLVRVLESYFFRWKREVVNI